VLDVAIKRERDREIPGAVGRLHKPALQADIAEGSALGAPDDVFDQSACILVRHIERQGLAPTGPVEGPQVPPPLESSCS